MSTEPWPGSPACMPSLAAPDGWTIGLVDPVAGGHAYFETRVAVEKA